MLEIDFKQISFSSVCVGASFVDVDLLWLFMKLFFRSVRRFLYLALKGILTLCQLEARFSRFCSYEHVYLGVDKR